MTMHLVRGLTSTGKRKGRVKFRNADEARRARELDESWKKLQSKWKVEEEDKRRSRAMRAETLSYSLSAPPGRGSTAHIPSRGTGVGNAVAQDAKVYTGDKMLGIGTLHKSNSVPVFSQDEAIDIAKMRR